MSGYETPDICSQLESVDNRKACDHQSEVSAQKSDGEGRSSMGATFSVIQHKSNASIPRSDNSIGLDTTMTLALDSLTHGQDDFSHDTLMGLQELDSHLSIFEDSTGQGRRYTLSSFTSLTSIDEFYDAEDTTHSTVYKEPGDPAFPLVPEDVTSEVGNDGNEPQPFGHRNGSEVSSSVPEDSIQIKLEASNGSLTSSMGTDLFDIPSGISSISSKATSPSDPEQKVKSRSRQQPHLKQPSTARPKHSVRPRVSIPTDLAPQEYARQCIAAAESSRLNPYGLHPEEHAMLRAHLSYSQVTTYLNIRNGILRLWVRNPLLSVLRNEALGCCRDSRWFDIASLCHEWLVRKGYINYGCLESINIKHTSPRSRLGKRKRKTVVVIGAGMAGLGCARQMEGLFAQFEDRFRELGEDIPKVILLEGRNRVGGRVYSRGLQTTTTDSKSHPARRCTAEMGGMIITGFDRGNPLNILVRGQLALPYYALRPTTTIYDCNGQPVDQGRDQLAESLYNDVLDRVSDHKFKVTQPQMIEGEKTLLNLGRDAHNDNSKTMKMMEETNSGHSVSMSNPPTHGHYGIQLPQVAGPELIPIASDRLTGRDHLAPGIAAAHTAAYKAEQMGWALKAGIDNSHDLDLGHAVQNEGATLGSVMDEAIMQFKDVVNLLPLDFRLVNWHIANLEYSNAVNYRELSLGGWDVDAGNEWEGKHTMIVGGYQQVAKGLLLCPRPLDIHQGCSVTGIKRATEELGTQTQVECGNGRTFQADYVVSSIPLGVLKQKDITFEPRLPAWKTGAIERLGFGILNKVILVYKTPFWDITRDIFGVLRPSQYPASSSQNDYSNSRGRFFQWFNVTKTSGVPTLLALMAGDAAYATEVTPNEALIREAKAILIGIFGEKVPDPVEAIVTRWGQDKFARGSYSYTSPGFRADDYEMMAKPVDNLFFAGEHTCGTHPATVHGAYLSGLRAASEVLESMLGPIKHPEPLLPAKDTASHVQVQAAARSEHESKDPKQARLEAYEVEIWNAIYAKLGDRPWRPAKVSANPYILFSKDSFDTARRRCEEGRRPGKGKPVPNEVRTMLAKMWKEATKDEKAPYVQRADVSKHAYAVSMAEYNAKATKWDRDALDFRKTYESQNPSIPGPKEQEVDDVWTRDRKAKRASGYAEDSDASMDS